MLHDRQPSLILPDGHFCGEQLMSREIAGLGFVESRYSPGLATPLHTHEQAYFGFLLTGTGSQTYGKKRRLLTPHTAVFYPPGDPQTEQFDKTGGRTFSFEIPRQWLDRFREFTTVNDYSSDFQGGVIASLALRLYREFHHSDEVSPLAMEGLTLEIMAEVTRRTPKLRQPRPPKWLVRAREILHDRFSETITLAAIAAQVGVHPVYLASTFRKYYGSTIGEYVRRLRVEFACREIALSDTPLVEIALAAGFINQAHFSRTFRHITGMAPKEYRRNFRHSVPGRP